MTAFSIKRFQTPKVSRIGDAALLISVILAGTVFPRLMLLGLFPATDDGYYAYVAQQIYHGLANGQGIPDSGGLSLYPLLCSWIFSFGYNPIISLRLIDLGVAIITAFLLYRVLARTCNSNTGAALITFLFTFTLNQAVFIDSGFRNSITAAFAPLFLALYVGTGAIQSKKSGNAWQLAGALTALAVVLRETFAPFAVLGLVSVFIAQGKKAALRFFIGGVATGILLIGGILMARGGVTEIIAAYRSAGAVFGSVPDGAHLDHFISYGLMTIYSSSIVLAFSALAIVILLFAIFLRRDKSLLLAMVFWLSFIGTALIEAAMKICYAYHFALALPGLAGLCALALREIIRIWPAIKLSGSMNNFLAVVGIVLSATWLYSSCSMRSEFYWPVTLETLTTPGGAWPEKFANQSNYLLAAAEIKKVIPENGTLSINRNMHVLYPLTGHLPPSRRLDDLGAITILLDFSVPDTRQVLLDCAPDVIMITLQDGWSTGGGSARLHEAVLATGIYETVARIPFGNRTHGHLGGIIFRKTKETACLVK
ncbi:MAG: hypothetical protein LBJ59_11230 [Zoogloeaceae bacterium]|jgi:hypothetical protein|nr:hypothetical protein [Zoogloeaceae bacterium]